MRSFQTNRLTYERHTMQSVLPPPEGYTEIVLNPGDHILVAECIKPSAELLAWCKESLRHIWAYDILICQFSSDTASRYQLQFQFENHKEAILFKLSWA